MAKGRWLRCPVTEIPLGRLPDQYQKADGSFDTSSFPDCNIFNIRSFAAAAGYRDPRYFRDVVLTDPSSPFHAHKLYGFTEKGAQVVVGFFTHVDSAQWGGEQHRENTLARQLAPEALGEGCQRPKLLPRVRF